MGQIIGRSAKPDACNIRSLSNFGIPAAGQYILVSSDNSANAAGQGNFDCYIVGDGTTAASALPLHKYKAEELDELLNGEKVPNHTYTSGIYIRQSGGVVASDADWCTTDYIPCKYNDSVVVNFATTGKNNYACCAIYDSQKNFLGAWTSNNYVGARSFSIDVQNTAFMRCCVSLPNIADSSVILNGQLVWYYQERLNKGFIESTSEIVNQLDTDINGEKCYKNYIPGKYINTNGTIGNDSDWAVTSDFIPINEGDTFLAYFGVNGKMNYACASVYNSNKQWLYTYTTNGYDGQRESIIETGHDEAYIKFSFYLPAISSCYAKINGKVVWNYKGSDGTGIVGDLTAKVVSSMGILKTNTYCITSAGKWSLTTVHSFYYKEVSEGDTFRFFGNANNYGYYAFLKDLSMSSGGTPSFADGTSGRFPIQIGVESADIVVPPSTNYLYICAVNDGQNQTPQAFYEMEKVGDAVSQMSSDINIINEELGIGGDVPNSFSYFGEKISFKNRISFIQYANNSVAGQSSAIYGDYLFILKDKLTNVICYNMTTQTLLYNLSTGYTKDAIWHCNQCQFGTLKYSQEDMFPVLYVTVSNNAQGRCAWVAYRIIPTLTNNEISSFTIEEVQTIFLPVMTDTNCLGNFNIAVDAERGVLWGYGRNNNSAASNYNKAMFACFPIPALSSSIVTYEDADIIDSFSDTWIMENAQGGFVNNGKLVIMQGYQSVGAINLRVIDLYVEKKQVSFADLLGNGFTDEPEGVFLYKGNIYTSTANTKIWKFMTL